MAESILNVLTHSKEIQFLRALIKENLTEARIFSESPGIVDFHKFTELIRQSGLGGICYDRLKRIGLLQEIPETDRAHLKEIYLAQWYRAEQKLAVMKPLKKIFERENIEVIFIKGLVTAELFYGDIAQRISIDLDILIKQKDLDGAARLLAGEGYVPKGCFFPNRKFAMRYALHHVMYTAPSGVLEVHWKLHNYAFFKITEEALWRSRKTVSLGDEMFPCLSEAYELCLQIFSQLGQWDFRRAIDIYTILKKMYDKTDWETFFEERRREGTLKCCVNVILFSLSLIDALGEFPKIKALLESKKELIISFETLRFQEKYLGFTCEEARKNIILKLNACSSLWQSVPWWVLTAISRRKGSQG